MKAMNRNLEPKVRWRRRVAIALIAATAGLFLTSVGLAVLPVVSFKRNRDFIKGGEEAMSALAEHRQSEHAGVDPIEIDKLSPLYRVERELDEHEAEHLVRVRVRARARARARVRIRVRVRVRVWVRLDEHEVEHRVDDGAEEHRTHQLLERVGLQEHIPAHAAREQALGPQPPERLALGLLHQPVLRARLGEARVS